MKKKYYAPLITVTEVVLREFNKQVQIYWISS